MLERYFNIFICFLSGYGVNCPLLGSSHAATTERSAQQDRKIESPSVIKAIKRKEEIHSKRTVPKEAWSEEKESLQIDIEGNGIGLCVCEIERKGAVGGVDMSVCSHVILMRM